MNDHQWRERQDAERSAEEIVETARAEYNRSVCDVDWMRHAHYHSMIAFHTLWRLGYTPQEMTKAGFIAMLQAGELRLTQSKLFVVKNGVKWDLGSKAEGRRLLEDLGVKTIVRVARKSLFGEKYTESIEVEMLQEIDLLRKEQAYLKKRYANPSIDRCREANAMLEGGMTKAQIARHLGKSPSWVAILIAKHSRYERMRARIEEIDARILALTPKC